MRVDLRTVKENWMSWLRGYVASDGGACLFDSLIRSLQGAESVCQHCGEPIFCDIVEGGGVPDWGTRFPDEIGGLDYGCGMSPDTNEEGTGSHCPVGVDEALGGPPQVRT
jgi:hypothetical protein